MKYDVFGPFEVPRNPQNRVDRDNLRNDFWAEVEYARSGLKNAFGCYVFSIRAGKGYTPWYIGMTANQHKGFESEVFAAHKIIYYNDVLSCIGKGTPIVHLIARLTNTGKQLSKENNKYEIEWLEKILISYGLAANPELKNRKNTKYLRDLFVPGILNSKLRGKLPQSCETLKKSLNL